jgi:hypothetical protein
LPLVFQDAAALARRLAIPHLWIDALCIVQDNTVDLSREISNMGHIYRNAFLNIGALEAAENTGTPPVGLFIDRNPTDNSTFALSIKRQGFAMDFLAHPNLHKIDAGTPAKPTIHVFWEAAALGM